MVKKEKFLKVAGVTLLCLFVLIACSNNPPQKKAPSKRLNVSGVTVNYPNLSFRPDDTFRWRREILWAQADNIPQGGQGVSRQYIRGLIEHQLTQKGYQFSVDGKKSTYELVAAVILGDSIEGNHLAELARLYPELGESAESLEKGTLMLGIAKPNSKILVWRSAVQVFIHEDISLQERKERLSRVVSRLLKTLP